MSDRVGKGSDFIKNETFPKALFIQFRFTFIMQCVIIFLRKMLQYLWDLRHLVKTISQVICAVC